MMGSILKYYLASFNKFKPVRSWIANPPYAQPLLGESEIFVACSTRTTEKNNSCAQRTLHLKKILALFLAISLVITSIAGAGEASIAVIYPNIGEPYREVFDKIIEGIKDKANVPVFSYPVLPDSDVGTLQSTLTRQNAKVIIALGRQGMKTAATLDPKLGIVVGGVLTVPENEVGQQHVLSLTPDPALLFSRLRMLMPRVKRVFVVYDPKINGWLMKLAKDAARAQGLDLVTYETQDLRSAVKFYQEIFSAADSDTDALWLPQDPSTVEESSILPLVLEKSWNQNLAIFSSNTSHVRRGVLFSLYPNNVALGRSLADLARGVLSSGNHEHQGMLPLRDVQIAVNLRTAKHLGLNTSRQQDFDMTFPEQ